MRGRGLSRLTLVAAVFAAPLPAAAPTGTFAAQKVIVATVNGVAILRAELDAEIDASAVPDGADTRTVQQRTLQSLIDRKLLAGALGGKPPATSSAGAIEDSRAEELARAQSYGKQVAATVPDPSEAQIARFMADHPNAFAARQTLRLDQVRFPIGQVAPEKLAILTPDHSMAAVKGHLDSLGIHYESLGNSVDTAQMATDLVKAIDGLPAGEPFVLPTTGLVTINVVVGRDPIPTVPAQARQGAIAAWRQQQFFALISARLAALRQRATITYQPGFAPQ